MKRSARQRSKDSRRKARVKRSQSRLVAAPKQPSLAKAAAWPLRECLISRTWQQRFELIQLIVARNGPDGQVAAGVFLIDSGCLGIKNAYGRIYPDQRAFKAEVKHISTSQALVPCTIHLAAKVLQEVTQYAARWGFAPHRDSREPLKLVADGNPALARETVPLGGEKGEPFYVAGPYDDSRKIVDQLVRTAGKDNFHYVVVLDDPMDDDFEADDDFTWVSPPGMIIDEDDMEDAAE